MLGGERTSRPESKDHSTIPEIPDNATILLESEPMKTVPSAPIAGDEKTSSPRSADHFVDGAVPLSRSAYTLLFREPNTMLASGPMAGDERTKPCASKAHFFVPSGLTAYKC